MVIEPLPAEERNAFEVLESFAEILGFLFKLEGEEGLRACLALPTGLCREDLESVAVELATVGLGKASAIVAEYAPDARPEIEDCPFEPGSLTARNWLRRRQRRRDSSARDS
jgi:hypothetical protein